jgi:hypothetical protein
MDGQYEIVIFGHLPSKWSAVFEGMQVICQPDGNTRITGTIPDQAALFGLLWQLNNLGLQLVSVNPLPPIGSVHQEPKA